MFARHGHTISPGAECTRMQKQQAYAVPVPRYIYLAETVNAWSYLGYSEHMGSGCTYACMYKPVVRRHEKKKPGLHKKAFSTTADASRDASSQMERAEETPTTTSTTRETTIVRANSSTQCRSIDASLFRSSLSSPKNVRAFLSRSNLCTVWFPFFHRQNGVVFTTITHTWRAPVSLSSPRNILTPESVDTC